MTAATWDDVLNEDDGPPGARVRPTIETFRPPTPGGEFMFATDDVIGAVWGESDSVLWAEGEPLLICGPTGVGKTTLAVALLRARIGLTSDVLGFPVVPSERKVLYIAADRPAQFRRAARRVFREHELPYLNARLDVHEGPPRRYLTDDPLGLVEYCTDHNYGTVFIDSLKDVAAKLVEDAGGAALNTAIQHAITAGVEVAGNHHYRKRQQGEARKPSTVDEIYGSTWITAGAGSVVQLWGAPGAAELEFDHLKQPSGEVGPFRLDHNATTGELTLVGTSDLVVMLREALGRGLTAAEVARRLYGVSEPADKDRKRAIRALDKLISRGLAHKIEGQHGGAGGQKPTVWRATTSSLIDFGAADT